MTKREQIITIIVILGIIVDRVFPLFESEPVKLIDTSGSVKVDHYVVMGFDCEKGKISGLHSRL
jgi:hypothetical protein